VTKFVVIVDRDQMDGIMDGRTPWERSGEDRGSFGSFFTRPTDRFRSEQNVAATLRAQIVGDETQRQRERCDIVGRIVAPRVALDAGRRAEEDGDGDAAARAYEACATYQKLPESATAALLLGRRIEESEPLAAEQWYRLAADLGESEARPIALLHLGMSVRRRGLLDEALEAYRRCVACGESVVRGMAAFRLGTVLEEQGDTEAAYLAYRDAVALDDEHGSPDAAVNLGTHEEGRGRFEEATRLWEYAYTSASVETRCVAALNLGRDAERVGRSDEARTWYDIAITSPDPEVTARARDQLRGVHPRDSTRARAPSRRGWWRR